MPEGAAPEGAAKDMSQHVDRKDIPLFQIDAFTGRPFGGNPAAVCPLDGVNGGDWLDDELLQAIAVENNLSETAYLLARDDGDFDLRWFTPGREVDLCGHATLASGHVILNRLDPAREKVTFHSRSGPLIVSKGEDGKLVMDFPAQPPQPGDLGDVAGAIGIAPEEVLIAPYGLAVLKDEQAVRDLAPDFRKISALTPGELIVTAPGTDCDFVSRFFAPGAGIDEDPVTGSAHCILTPYWAERLGKTEMFARQISARGGEIWCRLAGDRVILRGEAVEVITGTMSI